MTKYALGAIALSAFLFAGATENFAGGKKEKVAPKCPVKGKKINKSVFAKHNGGKVYFC